ncbi:MAG: hypothetical protein M3O15_12645, partial [Acidobacteriota bacterium]|nr:hypothetical protein [Acidobacteriota bacterium]
MDKSFGKVIVWGLFSLAVLAIPQAASAVLPVSPRRFVDFLDVRCYQISNQPHLNLPLRLDHLNPVLVGKKLPFENVVLQDPQQLCVPVAKNHMLAPPDTLPTIQFVDWKCYGITGPSIDLPLQLTQLNPVIAGLFGPNVSVTLREPQQLCVPVVKNGSLPPADVQSLVQFLDVKCYRVETTQGGSKNVTLTHLNPLLAGLPSEVSSVGPTPEQLCVPVTKNQMMPPPSILPYIQFADVLCYPATGRPLNMNLTLHHLNPV